ncbi:hypothetical protein LOTGIDRAFT_235471 [Lottia gigantea]|uniref:DSBA-like thioredoxin domain-containing protein n=1 Tax=Lottia gigantea TaxID=225164 RepID=V3ZQ37_LOTGI|nr:hypothetical protein LOTGIDRAFT_235471 [Lottia gigantea]ESO86447.1 hypothetical protein LOTGIDRAFT_235471 [Lottia gigantea]
MAELADKFEFAVRWEPFLLKPDTPPEGMPKPEMYSDPNNPRVQHLIQAGQAAGCEFTMKSKMFPNTLKAHALLEYAKEKDDGIKQNDVAENLFQKYFKDGNLLDEKSLLETSKQFDFNTDDVKRYINDDGVIQSVKDKSKSWKIKGVNGVPYFYINGQRMFSGAQDVDVFKKMFQKAADMFPVSRA